MQHLFSDPDYLVRIDAEAAQQQCIGYAAEIRCSEELRRVQAQIEGFEQVVGLILLFFAFHSVVQLVSIAEEHSLRHKRIALAAGALWVAGWCGAQAWLDIFELRYGLGGIYLLLSIVVPILIAPRVYKLVLIFRPSSRVP